MKARPFLFACPHSLAKHPGQTEGRVVAASPRCVHPWLNCVFQDNDRGVFNALGIGRFWREERSVVLSPHYSPRSDPLFT